MTDAIPRAVALMFEAAGRRAPTRELLAVYQRKLEPHENSPVLWRIFREASENGAALTIDQIGEKMRGQTQGAPEVRQLTEPERKRAEHAAVMSMVWLAYKYPDLAGAAHGIMAAAFGRQFGGDATAAVRNAMATISEEQAETWMHDALVRAREQDRAQST